MKFITRGAIVRLAALSIFIVLVCIWGYFTMIRMPGESYSGPLPELSDKELLLKEELIRDIQHLGGTIGERNIWNFKKLTETADWIESSLVWFKQDTKPTGRVMK
jgi:hypothetical protein